LPHAVATKLDEFSQNLPLAIHTDVRHRCRAPEPGGGLDEITDLVSVDLREPDAGAWVSGVVVRAGGKSLDRII